MNKINKNNFDIDFAELIGQMIYELHEIYQSFLRHEPLEESEPPDWDDEDETNMNDNIEEIPF